MPRLRTLDISGSASIRSLDWVAKMQSIQAIHARGCELLEDLRGVVSLPELVHLDLRSCELLRPIPKPTLMQNRDEVVDYKMKLARQKTRTPSGRKRPSNRALQSGLRRALRARDAEGTVDAIESLRRSRSTEAMTELLDGLALDRRASTLDLFASHVVEEGADQPVAQAALWRNEGSSGAPEEPTRLFLMRANRSFEGKPETRALRSWAMVKLLAMVPRASETAHLLRESITGIHLSQCPDGALPRLSSFSQLRTLSVGPVPREDIPPVQIEDLEPLGSLSGLRELRIQREAALRTLQGIESLELEAVAISDCPSLEDLRGLAWQTSLTSLSLETSADEGRFYEHLVDLSPLRGLKALQRLCLHGLVQLTEIKALAELSTLRELQLHGAVQLQSLSPLSGLESLVQASLCGLHRLRELDGIQDLPQLRELRLSHCQGLESLSGMGELPVLELLDLRGCASLSSLQLPSLPALKELDLSGCADLDEVFSLARAPALERLSLSPRREASMDGIGQCVELQHLDLSGEGIEDLDFLEDLEKLHTISIHLATAGDLQGLLRAPALQRVHVSESLKGAAEAVLSARPEITLSSVRSSD